MAKFKKGDVVGCKSGSFTKKTVGVIKEVRTTPAENNRVKRLYVVETFGKDGKPNGTFKIVEKKSLTMVEQYVRPKPEHDEKKKPEYFAYKVDKEACGNTVMVVGMLEDVKVPIGHVLDPSIVTNLAACGVEYRKTRKLSIGYAIQHEDDEDNPELGASIAKKRCKKSPMAVYYSPNPCEFREDLIEAICRRKLEYLCDKILKEKKNG